MISKTEIIVNILLHFFILFIILSLMFWLVISKMETQVITDEINNNISNYFDNAVQNMTPEQRVAAKQFAINADKPLEILSNIYSQPDKLTVNNNAWLRTTNILYGLVIFAVITTLLLTIRYVCKINDFPFIEILKENIALFTVVGIIEVVFFLKIGLRYIPTLPSAIVSDTLSDLRTKLG